MMQMSYSQDAVQTAMFPVRSNRTSILLGGSGTGIVFILGPILYWIVGMATGEWTFMGLLFTGVYGPLGIVFGVLALRKLHPESQNGVIAGRVLGVLSIVGGAMASFFCLFFLFLFGLIQSLN